MYLKDYWDFVIEVHMLLANMKQTVNKTEEWMMK